MSKAENPPTEAHIAAAITGLTASGFNLNIFQAILQGSAQAGNPVTKEFARELANYETAKVAVELAQAVDHVLAGGEAPVPTPGLAIVQGGVAQAG